MRHIELLFCAALSLMACRHETAATETGGEFGPDHSAILQGRVTTAAGQPVDSVIIAYRFLRPIDAMSGDHPLTDSQGRFRATLVHLSGTEIVSLDTISTMVYFAAQGSKYPRRSDGSAQTDS